MIIKLLSKTREYPQVLELERVLGYLRPRQETLCNKKRQSRVLDKSEILSTSQFNNMVVTSRSKIRWDRILKIQGANCPIWILLRINWWERARQKELAVKIWTNRHCFLQAAEFPQSYQVCSLLNSHKSLTFRILWKTSRNKRAYN